MKKHLFCGALLMGTAVYSGLNATESGVPAPNSREIRLVQDNANVRFATKIYTLKHLSAVELCPFIISAVKRYDVNSRVKVINRGGRGTEIMVTTGEMFMPWVDALVLTLDVPHGGIAGTGVSDYAYTPKYRAVSQFKELMNSVIGSSESASGIDLATNTIFWRDVPGRAERTAKIISKLDRPIPQARIRINYYEVRESTLRDVGFDYLAWKNGPGVNLFSAGYNAGQLWMNEMLLEAAQLAVDNAASWGYGGLFFAPAFDMSFIRCLQQSGEASVAANGIITVTNTPVSCVKEFRDIAIKQQKAAAADDETIKAPYSYYLTVFPEYQNIAKNRLGRSFVGASYETDETGELRKNPAVMEITISTPIVCMPGDRSVKDVFGFLPIKPGDDKEALTAGGVIFRYHFRLKNVVERGNTGQELDNATTVQGGATLGFNNEKVLMVYEKNSKVEQTIGLPILCKIPWLKYLFSTTTFVDETTYIVVTAEAAPIMDAGVEKQQKSNSRSAGIHERKQNDFWED